MVQSPLPGQWDTRMHPLNCWEGVCFPYWWDSLWGCPPLLFPLWRLELPGVVQRTRDTSTVSLLNQHVSHLTLKCSLWEKHNGLFVEVTFSVTCNQKQSFLLTFIKPDAIANLFLRLSFLRLELPVGFQTVCKRKKKVSLHSSWDHMPSKSIPLKVYPNFKEPLFMKSTLSIFIFWFVLFLF